MTKAEGRNPEMEIEQRLRDGEAVEVQRIIDELWRLRVGWQNERDYAATLRDQVAEEAPTVHDVAADLYARELARNTEAVWASTATYAYDAAEVLVAERARRIEAERAKRWAEWKREVAREAEED